MENPPPAATPKPQGVVALRTEEERGKWGNSIEFLMSCIATSVGLGNVWRFPFVAYQNGGGAFLIPYVIVLLVVGKPMYFMETAIGQFSSSNCVHMWAMCPAMKGTGYLQALGTTAILSYYVAIVALCMYYLTISTFQAKLPWSVCKSAWENCVPSGDSSTAEDGKAVSSAEYYFTKDVLRQSDGIHKGVGLPLWDLTICLFVAWFIIYLIVARSVRSTGKAAYFLAIFPYTVMLILLIRAVTLPGAVNGIMFFITPKWGALLEIQVWYAAVTQVFFSLGVCTGALTMFASYNKFSHNVYRDAMIVTTLDTFTSFISGITIFGVLGNLAHQLKIKDVSKVVGSGGTSLAFISYPDAIAQSPFLPHFFAFLFFLMMTVLGIGSGVGLFSSVNAVFLDTFPNVKSVIMSGITCTIGFLLGIVYVTPGGQYILELVDYYGGTFMVLIAGIGELAGVIWVYGLEHFCVDIEFMLHMVPSIFWRICWGIITPVLMIIVFVYALATTNALIFGEKYVYPKSAYVAGVTLQYIGVFLIPIFILMAFCKVKTTKFFETVERTFGRAPDWGPRDPARREQWLQFCREAKAGRVAKCKNWYHHLILSVFKGYRKKAAPAPP